MEEKNNDKIPLFGSWTQWYLMIVVVLLVLIVLFYLLTQNFA